MTNDIFELVMAAPGRNALSSALMTTIVQQLQTAAGRPVLLTGAGEAFSAGLNLKEVAGLDEPGMARFLALLDALVDALYEYPGPTVACVNGHAIAGGCIVALCCDLRVAADDPSIRIGLNEVPLGLEFPPKLLTLVRRRCPPRWIERIVLEGALHDPAAAKSLGLVDIVAADAPSVARATLERLASSPRAEYLAAKRALRPPLTLTPAERRHHDEHIVRAWCAPAVKERARAQLARKG